MPTQYLISCSCGREVPVEPGQAGDLAVCQCGQTLAVPKLGELRLLPRIETSEHPKTWSLRQGWLTLGGLVAVIALACGVYFWAVTPSRSDYDPSRLVAQLDAHFDSLSPAGTWRHWIVQTQHLVGHGLQEDTRLQSSALNHAIETGRRRQKLAFGTAGFALLFCLAVAICKPCAARD